MSVSIVVIIWMFVVIFEITVRVFERSFFCGSLIRGVLRQPPKFIDIGLLLHCLVLFFAWIVPKIIGSSEYSTLMYVMLLLCSSPSKEEYWWLFKQSVQLTQNVPSPVPGY
jgi:hypothetical protein